MSTPTPQELLDAVVDLGRIVTRQGATIDRLVDDSRATAARARAGGDVPLLVELHAMYLDAARFAGTSRAKRERAAFEAFAASVERLIAGRAGALVAPSAGAPFDALDMEAVEVVPTADEALDRTVAALLAPGLKLAETGRTVRPARVCVSRLQRPGPRTSV